MDILLDIYGYMRNTLPRLILITTTIHMHLINITGIHILVMHTGITGLMVITIIFLLMLMPINTGQITGIIIIFHHTHTYTNMLTGTSLTVMLLQIMHINTSLVTEIINMKYLYMGIIHTLTGTIQQTDRRSFNGKHSYC